MASAADNGKCRIAVFASGNGSNLQALIDACKAEEIDAEIVAVVSNHRYAFALNRAREAKIETLVFEPEKFKTRTEMFAKTTKALQERDVRLVCLAGYMLKLEPSMIRAFPNRILNIHPALLPSYGGKGMYGRHVHTAVIGAGATESGCTVHLVDEIFDHGPILAQTVVPVERGDTPETLAKRIHPAEHQLYVDVVRRVCAGELDLDAISKTIK